MEERHCKILIVDDHAGFRVPLGNCLRRRLKASLTEIDNGLDAIEAIKRLVFDLVILDIGIPGCDGWEVIRAVREFNQEIKIIVVSGRADLSDEQKTIVTQHTAGFIKKPILDLAGLVRQISFLLGGGFLIASSESEQNDYKGRPEVRDVIHAFENLFNNIESQLLGFIEDYEDGILKDKSPTELVQEVIVITENVRRITKTRQQLFDVLRKL